MIWWQYSVRMDSVQCGDNSAKKIGVCTQVRGLTFAASQEQCVFKFNKPIPAFTCEVPVLTRQLKWKACRWGDDHFYFTQKSVSTLVNHCLSKMEITLLLALWLNSRLLEESSGEKTRGETTVSKILPWTLANRGSACSYTQQHQAF